MILLKLVALKLVALKLVALKLVGLVDEQQQSDRVNRILEEKFVRSKFDAVSSELEI